MVSEDEGFRRMSWFKKTVPRVLSLVVLLFLSPLQFFHELWHHALRHSYLVYPAALSLAAEAYAEVLSTVEEALRTFMPDADEIREEIRTLTGEQRSAVEKEADLLLDPQYEKDFHFFVGRKKGEIIAYAAPDTVPGKWGPIHYMLLISPEGRIQDVLVLEYWEKRGRPVAKKRFLKQFKGRTAVDDLRLMKDIRGVTGASISSQGMTNGIRKMLHVFREVYGRN